MSPTPSDYRWETDTNGAQWAGDVKYVTELWQANKALAAADTAVLMAVASLIPIFMPLGILRAVVGLGLIAIDIAQFGVAWFEENSELRFALGASPVLGRDRLDTAEAQQLPTWQIYVLGVAAVLGVVDLVSEISTASVAAARARAVSLVEQFETGGLNALKTMASDDSRDLLLAIFDARLTAEEATGVLEPLTSRLVRTAGQLGSELLDAARAAEKSGMVQAADAALESALPDALRAKIPVVVDDTLAAATPGTRAAVRATYTLDGQGFLSNIELRVGSGAIADDVASHVDTLNQMLQYTEQANAARGIARKDQSVGQPLRRAATGKPRLGGEARSGKTLVDHRRRPARPADQRNARSGLLRRPPRRCGVAWRPYGETGADSR